MTLSMLIIMGSIVGVVLSALSHPMIYRSFFGGPLQSDDHHRKPS